MKITSKQDRELLLQIHAYLDICYAVLTDELCRSKSSRSSKSSKSSKSNDWTYKEAASSIGVSGATVKNMWLHEDTYCPNSLSLAKLASVTGIELIFTKQNEARMRVKRSTRKRKAA
jgi:hypothetical protein